MGPHFRGDDGDERVDIAPHPLDTASKSVACARRGLGIGNRLDIGLDGARGLDRPCRIAVIPSRPGPVEADHQAVADQLVLAGPLEIG